MIVITDYPDFSLCVESTPVHRISWSIPTSPPPWVRPKSFQSSAQGWNRPQTLNKWELTNSKHQWPVGWRFLKALTSWCDRKMVREQLIATWEELINVGTVVIKNIIGRTHPTFTSSLVFSGKLKLGLLEQENLVGAASFQSITVQSDTNGVLDVCGPIGL